jgi:predicted XRE-type DNA-binding protein
MPKTSSSTLRRATRARRAERHQRADANASEASVTTVGPNDNIFAALKLPNADEWLAKAELARAIRALIEARGLTQIEAATALGGVQSDISNLARGRLAGYSMERLYRFLNALDQDVRIVVRPKPHTRSHATVRALVQKTA